MIRWYPELPSTQSAALRAARAASAEGSVFVAERQTAGRGRHGHTWASPPGAGLYCSLLLWPRRPVADLLLLTLASGLAAADAVREACGLEAEIRWPNDLLFAGKKFGGILIESALEGGRLCAALGVGLNLRPAALPPELAPIATALDDHLPRPCDRWALLQALVASLARRYRAWSNGEDAALLAEFTARSRYAQGLEVVVGGADGYRGATAGLEVNGFLRVRLASGEVRTVVSGDVRPA